MDERCFLQHPRLHVCGVVDENINMTIYLECLIDSGFDLLVRLIVIESWKVEALSLWL